MTLRERCAPLSWLALDVDGVLTEGGICYAALADGTHAELKTFHVRDGSSLKRWHASGRRSMILTGRDSPVVARRAAELGVAHVAQGAEDKRAALTVALARLGIDPAAVCYVGDDLPDVPAMAMAGLAAAPADACPEARSAAHYVCRRPGGLGAVREVVDLVLACR